MGARITIYGRADCHQCAATARKAEDLGLTFVYVDVDEDIASAARLIAADHRTLPVVEAGGQVWTGFRPDLLAKLEREDG